MIVGLCERFHVLPSQLEEESAELLRLVAIVQMGTKQEDPGELPDEEEIYEGM